MPAYRPTLANGHSLILDVSQHQGRIDWKQVADAYGGLVRGVYIRWSKGPQLDTRALENIDGAHNVGLPIGTYLFADYLTDDDPYEQVARWIADVTHYRPEATQLGFCLDVERRNADPTPDKARTREWFRRAFQTPVDLVYTNTNATTAFGLEGDLWPGGARASVPRWVDTIADIPAAWGALNIGHATERTPPATRLASWQYTNKGRVPGIAGNVDLNMMLTSVYHRLRSKAA